ncbi:MAG TPA: septum formation protein Maf [Caldithrix abyssi]|uniref:dTTP/UTP pyrophosphatase n=1 Tax=Caldithrix abyssi TaxID=187145 RepID=A0A7V1LPM8_CALAY|nr:septum formation protein Maf [Caldithrix abyssi]
MIFSLIENLEHVDIVLASASPRRFELLKSVGLDFKVVPAGIDESKIDIKEPTALVQECARQKGEDIARQYPDHLVISADTIVSLDGNILGKPRNEDHAYDMLAFLSGKTHQVYTAFGLFYKHYEKELLHLVCTDVTMRVLTDEIIMAYIGTGEPVDKAGAYAIQGQGAMLIEGIRGSYTNVVGFPLAQFFDKLDHFLGTLVLSEKVGDI